MPRPSINPNLFFQRLCQYSICSFFDPIKLLFSFTLLYAVSTLLVDNPQTFIPEITLFFLGLFLWLVAQIICQRFKKYAEPINACLALFTYLILLFSKSEPNETPPASDLMDLEIDRLFLGILERTMVFTFIKSYICIVLHIVVLISRYLVFHPAVTRTVLLCILGDITLLFYIMTYLKQEKTNEYNARGKETKSKCLQKSLFSNLYTPLLFLDSATMKPVFQNKEMDLLLAELSLKLSDFFDMLKIKPGKNAGSDDVINLCETMDTFPKCLLKTMKKTLLTGSLELRGTLSNIGKSEFVYSIRVFRAYFENTEAICVQFKDISLHEKIKRLEDTVAYKEHVLNTVAHDLRNPLGAIMGMLKAMDNIINDIKAKEYIKTCSILGELLMSILTTYLDGSQIRNNKLKLVPAEINMKAYLKDIFKIFDFLCRQKNITFSVKVKTKIPRVIISDKYRLTQILVNLISNAIKFTTSGQITLLVRTENKPNDQVSLLTFAVKDTGIGISVEDQQKLFGAFSKLDTGSKLNPYGVGLGLLISNELVGFLNRDQPKACISVESVLNKGSTFSFTISSSLQSDSSPAVNSCECIELSFLSKDSDNELSVSNSHHDIEAKMLDYSRDYGRLNGSKFHSPRADNKDSPKSFTLLLENSMLEAMRKPRNAVTQLPSAVKSIFTPNKVNSAGTIIQEKCSGQHEAINAEKGRFTNFLRISRLETQAKFPSFDKIRSPTNKASRFKPDPEEVQLKPILVVDDNPFNILAVSPGLIDKGFEISSALNGEECIEAVKEKAKDEQFFKAILMDCDMPVMDGFEATKILVEMISKGEIPVVPIVGLTGADDQETITKCKEVGMIGVLRKPLQEQKLWEILNI